MADDMNEELRHLIEVVRTADLDAGIAEGRIDPVALGATIRSVADELGPLVVDGPRMQATLHGELGGFDDVAERREAPTPFDAATSPAEFFPFSPVIGLRNPISPPVRLTPSTPAGSEWAEITGEVTLGAAYNGPPGAVHGGIIAAVFDELLGTTAVVNDVAGFTGTLTVVYRSPTPLDTEITMRGWIDRVEGRKTFARGEIHHGETLCAEAEGIFIGFMAHAGT